MWPIRTCVWGFCCRFLSSPCAVGYRVTRYLCDLALLQLSPLGGKWCCVRGMMMLYIAWHGWHEMRAREQPKCGVSHRLGWSVYIASHRQLRILWDTRGPEMCTEWTGPASHVARGYLAGDLYVIMAASRGRGKAWARGDNAGVIAPLAGRKI
jgi:hypothetical protein